MSRQEPLLAAPGGGLRRADALTGALLALPAALVLVLLTAGPAFLTILYSFQDVPLNSGLLGGQFVGLDNYARVLGSTKVAQSVEVTLVFGTGFVAISTLLGLAFALLLNQPMIGRGLARTLLVLPWAVPWAIIGIMWRWFLDADVGALNGLLFQFGLISENQAFLSEPRMALFFAMLAASWRQASLNGVLMLAALQTLPHELTEAARVDGANIWQRFRFVTVPWLRPIISAAVVVNVIYAFLMFDLVFTMTQGGPGDATMHLSILLYRELFLFTNPGIAATLSVLLALLSLVTALILVRLIYRPVRD